MDGILGRLFATSKITVFISRLAPDRFLKHMNFHVCVPLFSGNHSFALFSNAIWTSKFHHFYHLPLRKSFGGSIAMKTVFCIKVHINFRFCRKRSGAYIVTKLKVFGIAQTFNRGPLEPPRASLFTF